MQSLIDTFEFQEDVSEVLKKKYEGFIPSELLKFWDEHGLGLVLGGYLRIINPDDYLKVIRETFLRSEDVIPIFSTAMGDLLCWQKDPIDNSDGFIMQLNYRKGISKIIAFEFDLFVKFLTEEPSFRVKKMDWQPYIEAAKRNGPPEYDECFGYVPLLGLGGDEKVENLKKVKIVEHIYLIKELIGPIE
ncbi:T6SS immunity protein Tdi1 domain-containing protein [Alkalicoccobacillus murimartini]|uniref:DUF1851 domain-containing protein n=1 Tax=Alkalicoccobacillus murimartini TaxID=171685 RepID=A0ABT9YH04_9BACI|nr:T6SS immunity protein Tdi1 domain-containing protein [Alkalicoccobacillus murimartini]MDQ0206979.1 hypothetical protein [Alkalicoccobacillus murimartini]